MPAQLPSEHLKARKFVSFALVGGAATAIHWSIAAALLALSALPPIAASTVGFVLSAAFNLVSNARFTFNERSLGRTHVTRFALAAVSGCAWNAVVLDAGLAAGLPVAAGQVLATAIVLAWNFALNALWVFRRPDSR